MPNLSAVKSNGKTNSANGHAGAHASGAHENGTHASNGATSKPGRAGQSRTTVKDRGAMVWAFATKPFVIGAVAPSSRFVAQEMTRGIGLERAGTVLEFGPGTGAFTGLIKRTIRPDARYLAIELNPHMADRFRAMHPDLTLVQDSVENVEKICAAHGVSSVDTIVSGLPWASFPDDLQERCLSGILNVLKPGGVFATFGYHIGTWLPAGKRFYGRLPELFRTVERSRVVWRNFPPAFVVRCVK